MRRRGEMSASEFASEIGVHERTVRRWVVLAIESEPSRLRSDEVRRDVVTGRIYVEESAVERILSGKPDNPDNGNM